MNDTHTAMLIALNFELNADGIWVRAEGPRKMEVNLTTRTILKFQQVTGKQLAFAKFHDFESFVVCFGAALDAY